MALEPNALEDIFRDIERVAVALDVPERGAELVQGLKARMAAVTGQVGVVEERPSVATIEWIDPLMAGGNWMPALVELAGGENLFGKHGEHSPMLAWNTLKAADPDIIFVMPCGYDIPTTLREMPALTAHPGWHDLKAVKNGRVYITDGNQYFNRPGPRVAESLEILAEIFYPDQCHYHHEGTGWQVYRP